MSQTFSRDILRSVVAQVCQTIGWHAIQTTPLDLMVDFLHRNLEEICKVTHRYTEQFGQTMPNLDHLGLAFQDLGIDLQDLGDYVKNVTPVPYPVDVPAYPVEREAHLNFLKPGSHEVVHRPVHVHEHLPPMHPDMEDPGKPPPLLTDASASMPVDGASSSTNGLVFKRPGDPLESPAMKRTRLQLEEEGRPLREISSVMMTTSGFLSPAREGKLPESRVPCIPSDVGRQSPTPSSFPAVPPEIKSEKKTKKSLNKKSNVDSKKSESKKKVKEGVKTPKVKKLAGMKEVSKLKALKKKKTPIIASEGNPKDFANFLENLAKSSNQAKSKTSEPAWVAPGTSKEVNTPVEKTVKEVSEKLSAEPDKQKLNIFKKISKVKEEKNDVSRGSRESSIGGQNEEVDKSWPAAESEGDEDEDVYISDNLSPPGTPSTPKTPELPSKMGGKKKKKDKSKSKSKKLLAKKAKLEQQTDSESLERPKTPEVPNVSLFPFASHFPPAPGLIPPPIMNHLFPNLPFPKPVDSTLLHPAMPNLPVPPINFMQPSVSTVETSVVEEEVLVEETQVSLVEEPKPEVPVEKEKKSKESKKEEKDKKPKKKKLKKEKIKSKEKSEKKKEKEEKKAKDKEKSKEKKEKKKEREREEKVAEPAVPKITFKLGPDNSRPSTPEGQTRKIVIKPIVKKDDEVTDPKRTASPELARFAPLITRQPKQKSKMSEPEVIVPEIKPEPKQVKETKKAAVVSGSSKDTVAFYHSMVACSGNSSQDSNLRILLKVAYRKKHGRGRPPGSGKHGAGSKGSKPGDDAGNKIWICPACKGPDDGSPMIGCDDCDAWYHWVCVGIQVPPDEKENWYCRECIQRKQETTVEEKKKKGRKKKIVV